VLLAGAPPTPPAYHIVGGGAASKPVLDGYTNCLKAGVQDAATPSELLELLRALDRLQSTPVSELLGELFSRAFDACLATGTVFSGPSSATVNSSSNSSGGGVGGVAAGGGAVAGRVAPFAGVGFEAAVEVLKHCSPHNELLLSNLNVRLIRAQLIKTVPPRFEGALAQLQSIQAELPAKVKLFRKISTEVTMWILTSPTSAGNTSSALDVDGRPPTAFERAEAVIQGSIRAGVKLEPWQWTMPLIRCIELHPPHLDAAMWLHAALVKEKVLLDVNTYNKLFICCTKAVRCSLFPSTPPPPIATCNTLNCCTKTVRRSLLFVCRALALVEWRWVSQCCLG
jgi:hypothetical protein